MEGKGGSVRVINGVDFWQNGEADRKDQIVGVIDDKRGGSLFALGSYEKDTAKLVKQKGCDAVILVDSERVLSGIDNHGNVKYSKHTKVVVVKYVE